MLTSDQLFSAMGAYNEAIFPFQFILLILGIVLVVWLLFKPDKIINIAVKTYFAFCYAFAAIALFIILLPVYLLAGFLLVVAALFLADIFLNKIEFSKPAQGWMLWMIILFFLLILLYPVFNELAGRHYPSTMMLGALPCPTTALALVLLAAAIPRVMRTLYILLLFEAVPLTLLLLIPVYGIYEDLVMLAAGLFALIMLIINWKKIEAEQAGGSGLE